jgi:hypothetical protein
MSCRKREVNNSCYNFKAMLILLQLYLFDRLRRDSFVFGAGVETDSIGEGCFA